MSNRRLRIGILGSKGTTLDLLHGLLRLDGIEIARVFFLNETSAARNAVAYFSSDAIRALCGTSGIPVTELKSYTLADADDVAAFDSADLDILCVIGWERIVPDRILTTVKQFACGMHGSSYGLPRGRGRSPMNWSILTGQTHFTTYLFRYAPGVDDGDVVDFRTFEITERDTIGTLHNKNRQVMQMLLERTFRRIQSGTLTFSPQPDVASSFYPKRTPEHGVIDWRETTEQIDRLIRAVAPPYPAAFCFLRDRRMTIERAQPFDRALYPTNIPAGTVLDVAPSSGHVVVKTIDGSLLIETFDGVGIDEIAVGMTLSGGDRSREAETLASRYGAVPPDEWEVSAAWFQR